jgi:hypothetical protein
VALSKIHDSDQGNHLKTTCSTLTESRISLIRLAVDLGINVPADLNHRFIIGGILAVGFLGPLSFSTFVLATLLFFFLFFFLFVLLIVIGPLDGLLGGLGLIENRRHDQSA